MTQASYFWGGTATGDATLAPYPDDTFSTILSMLLQYDYTTQGVVYTARAAYTGMLAVSNPAGTTIRVATGIAMVAGRAYLNSANVDNDVNGLGTGYYRVVLQKLEAAQTVRVAILGPVGGAPPAVTQDAATWEISLATFYFDDGTNTVSSLTDTRDFLYPMGTTRTRTILVPAISDDPSTHVYSYAGVDTGAADLSIIHGYYRLDEKFVGNLTASFIANAVATGNMYRLFQFYAGAEGENYGAHSDTIGYAALAVGSSAQYLVLDSLSLPDASAGDYISLLLARDATDPLDTIDNSVKILGFLLSFTETM